MIRIASKQAVRSPFERHKLGAVIVKGDRVLATGYNEIRWNKRLNKSNIHAEEAAIVKLLRLDQSKLCGSDLFVSRVRPSGTVGLAKPCPSCASLIRAVGIRRVSYTTDNGGVESYDAQSN